MKKKALVTTSIEETWLHDAHIVFLGDWCKKYSKKDALEDISHETLSFHWEDRNKFKKDSVYLKRFNEVLLNKLHIVLNEYHNTNHSLRFWRIIIGPWLAIIVPAIFDRWEHLKNAMTLYKYDTTVLNKYISSDLIRPDYLSSAISLQDDSWNYSLYSHIIEKEYGNLDSKIFTNIRSKRNKPISKDTILKRITRIFDMILSKIKPKYTIAFVNSYFSTFTKVKLALRFRQFPRSYSIFDQEVPQISNFDDFRNTNIELKVNTPFENYISKNILQFLPSSYLECFADIQLTASSLPDKVELIFTANAHFSNDIFKIWCANQVENMGAKFIVSSHGGAIPSEFSFFTDHEEAVSDKRVVWHSSLNANQVQLPANKYLGAKTTKEIREDKVTIIGLDTGLYSYGMQSGPNSSLMLFDIEQKQRFITSLVKKFNRKIGYYPAVTESWESKLRFSEHINAEDITTYNNYSEALQKSKLIICSYPQTTLSDALFSEVPFILLYTEEYWTFPNHFKSLVDKLKKVKIIFTNPILAAEHVNLIWDNPEEWWNNDSLQKVKREFLDECLTLPDNGIEEWYEFLSSELENKV